jgi:hypothetical protein
MATKTDFSETEWTALQRGVTGSGLLVSLSDRDLSDTFGEVGAMTKYLAEQGTTSPSELVRELSKTRGSGFGLTSSAQTVRDETMAALRTALATLAAKDPADVGPYRDLVLGVADAVARAKGGGVSGSESAMLDQIREVVGAA